MSNGKKVDEEADGDEIVDISTGDALVNSARHVTLTSGRSRVE